MNTAITSAILDSMSDGVIVIDLKGRVVFVNRAACDLLRLDKATTTEKTYVDLFMGDPENDAFNDILIAGIQNGDVHAYREVPFRRPDGKVLQLAVTTSFFPGTEGSMENSGIVTVFKDITESKALDRARQRVIDHLSHELQTPLAIAGATLHRIADAQYETFVRRIDRCLARLREIQQEVGDIVRRGNTNYTSRSGLSALEQTVMFLEMVAERDTSCAYSVQALKEEIESLFPKAEITPEPLQVGEQLQAIADVVRAKAAHRSVVFSVSNDNNLRVWIDKGAFRNVLIALIKNAIEATPDGGRVSVSARLEGNRVQIAVEDTGVGITEESRKEIFGGFYHANDTQVYSTKEPFDFGAGGKGLDLLRVRLLSTAYNFDIECESRRCRFLPDEKTLCPGSVEKCTHAGNPEECAAAGGTTFRLLFMPCVDAEIPSRKD